MKNFTRVPNTLVRSNRLSYTAFRLYVAIASYNPSYPSYITLQKVTGMSSATIIKSIHELEHFGLISYLKGSNQGKANEYYLQAESNWKLPTSEGEALQKRKHFETQSNTASNSEVEPLQKLKHKKTNVKKLIQKDPYKFELALEEYKKLGGVQKGPCAEKRFRQQMKNEGVFQQLISSIKNYRTFLSWSENSYRRPKSSFETFLGSKASGFFWHDFIELPKRGGSASAPSAEMEF